MNKKSKEIVKKLCFTLVVVISIITIIGCPNTVSSKANGTDNKKPDTPAQKPQEDKPINPDDWSGLTADQVIQKMKITKESEVVTDLQGLGFGMIDNKLCLSYGEVGDLKGTPKLLSKAKDDIENKIGTWNDYPTGDSYSSIKDGLEKRWFAATKTVDSEGGSVKWLNKITNHNSCLEQYLTPGRVKSTYSLSNIGFTGVSFAVDVEEDGLKLFAISTVSGGDYGLLADWQLVFVEKKTNPKMYSFHYGPYTLKGKYDNNNPTVPLNYDSKVHMFTLPEMLKDYLKKKGKEAIADKVIKDFPPLLPENKGKYDVYLVIGKVFTNNSTFYCYEYVYYSFRNVFKLTDDDFWNKCWKP